MALSLQTAYDQYLSNNSLFLSGQDKAESKKKSDSTDVYRSMMKLNRNSPVFIQDFTEASKQAALQLKQDTIKLKDSLSPFIPSEFSLGDRFQSAMSSDSSMADISYSPGFESSAPKEFTFQVEQTASNQVNRGYFLPSNSKLFETGEYSFDISTDRASYAFELSISENDSTSSIQSRIAKLINRSHIGISAELLQEKGNSALELCSIQQGIPPQNNLQFQVSDSHYQNPQHIVSVLGFDHVVQYPDNAAFTIDGKEYSSSSNQISLTNGFQILLKEASFETAKVSLHTDTDDISQKIETMISLYNDALDEIREFKPPSPSIRILAKDVYNVPKSMEQELSFIGISINPSSEHLSYSKEFFLMAYEKEPDAELLLKPLTDCSRALSKRLNQVVLNPLRFICGSMVSYKDVTKDNLTSPYDSSVYSGIYFNEQI